MAEEATLGQDTETTADPLAEFQEFLDKGGPAGEEAEGDDPEVELLEQVEGVEVSADLDAGDPETPAIEPEVEVVAEGPSFLMKQEAERAGVDPALAAIATSDAQLQRMIEVEKSRVVHDSAAVEDDVLKFELPEDEYPADDPLRKALAPLFDQLNGKLKELRQTQGHLARFANERLEREEQQAYQTLYSPFDEALDSFESPVLGKTGKLTETQRAERAAVAQKYLGLGATVEMPAADKTRLAELALTAHRKDLVDQRNTKTQAKASQAKQVLGGGGKRSPKPAVTKEDLLKEWQDGLDGKRPLDL